MIVRTSDLEAAQRLYRDLLGLDVELVAEPPERKAEVYLEVAVPDVRAAVSAARAQGVPVLREWTEGGRPRALLADPDGNLLEICID